MRTHGLSCLLEPNLRTRFLVKSLEIEALQQMLGVYITNSPYTRTCIYAQPPCATDDVWNPYQSELPSVDLPWLAKQGKPPTPASYSLNETACGGIDGSTDACVGTEMGPDGCGVCTVLRTAKGRYGSRVAGTDCAAMSHVDAVSRISDECAVRSRLARWSVDDDATACNEDQPPDTPSPAIQASQTTISAEARHVLQYESQQNTTGIDHVKPHAREVPRSPASRWMGKRDVPSDRDHDHVPHPGLGHVNEDWTRIPDYRRHLA
ncbi:hypothetical protein GSI_10689 [Ganoderma sinense ZZ0214-1]|uniref:Uncharacterized protein n=1 Tax=Ganoderma sinense ZZ0214-1 TaxID=1077348 RepID=A0A2G8S1U8_9APHY|nr:hypothetical protein GSI_10689 [Ganoderma sinense ZZ0214-1]